ncbi:c-type cytochrome [Pontibacter sp. G13]|uniref:DUF7133 domain-containing protein n=1 Tax=Pontibacter sp. G13 TaxID=3074898 RepID=UPI00288A9C45|nr:c-type cytochrome [Pontibacter sp. G13]WNJ17345.1 c-type cytochrome [Pontibacter sp. G13]
MYRFLLFACMTGLMLGEGCSEAPRQDYPDDQIDSGFQIQVVAQSPQIIAPVAMDMDEEGRLWVVEMQSYMTDIAGNEEEAPNSRIVILSDLDDDGVFEAQQTFLDSLVLPRAICLAYGGLLYAEAPNLWFVELEGLKPGARTLVDSAYVRGGNVEHQPNALTWHVDNWIYSAKSSVRYRRLNGQWIKEQTAFRGQWGLTADAKGRLFYNNNSAILQGDAMLPNAVDRESPAYRQFLDPDQIHIYPLHATSVNRGYVEGTLDELGRLKRMTSAAGPVIYQGNHFPEQYHGHVFTPEPGANLIKRTQLVDSMGMLMLQEVNPGQEFYATRDEAFRPVNLYNSLDGAMYVVDMHRGIIQHSTYMTAYLREEILRKGLDEITQHGQILKITYPDRKLDEFDFSSPAACMAAFSHDNGLVRLKAQHVLISENQQALVPQLWQILLNKAVSTHARVHALWTLEGLDALETDPLWELTTSVPDELLVHVLRCLQIIPGNPPSNWQRYWDSMISRGQVDIDRMLTAGVVSLPFSETWEALYNSESAHLSNDKIIAHTVLSRQGRRERFAQDSVWQETQEAIAEAIERKKLAKKNRGNHGFLGRGLTLFRTHCATCHGTDGGGVEGLAPPLLKSEYITESKDRLALVLLHGLKGPIHVRGKRYEFAAVMPGLATNSEFTDRKVADLVGYLRNTFGDDRSGMDPSRISELREEGPESGGMFREHELLSR